MLDRRQIIGLGSGRCGTHSLSQILTQGDCFVTHEQRQMDWYYNNQDLQTNLQLFKKRPNKIVGDVALWWLNYVPLVNAKFICLKRNKIDTVNSFLNRWRHKDYWTVNAKGSQKIEQIKDVTVIYKSLNSSFPTFPYKDKQQAIQAYYDLYYTVAGRFEKQLSNFKIFDIECLNTEEGQQSIFDWLNLPDHKFKKVHDNKWFKV